MFPRYVKKHFEFLVTDYAFAAMRNKLGYVKGPLEIEFYSGKGEVDVLLFVRRDDEVFCPTVSRSFELLTVARFVKGDTLESFKELFPDRAYTNDEQSALVYCCEILRRYCSDILQGDLGTLETLHLERR